MATVTSDKAVVSNQEYSTNTYANVNIKLNLSHAQIKKNSDEKVTYEELYLLQFQSSTRFGSIRPNEHMPCPRLLLIPTVRLCWRNHSIVDIAEKLANSIYRRKGFHSLNRLGSKAYRYHTVSDFHVQKCAKLESVVQLFRIGDYRLTTWPISWILVWVTVVTYRC